MSNILQKSFYKQYGLYLRAFVIYPFQCSPRSRFSLFKYNNERRDKMKRVQNCSEFRDWSRNQSYSAVALHRLTCDEGASRAGRYLGGTCVLAIRFCNR